MRSDPYTPGPIDLPISRIYSCCMNRELIEDVMNGRGIGFVRQEKLVGV